MIKPSLISFRFLSAFLILLWIELSASGLAFKPITPLPNDPLKITSFEEKKTYPIVIKENMGLYRRFEVIQGGIPFPKGEIYDHTPKRLLDQEGKEVPVQFEALNRWWDYSTQNKNRKNLDISIRWLHIVFQTTLNANQEKVFYLEYGKQVTAYKNKNPLLVLKTGKQLVVNTGKIKAIFDQSKGQLIQIYHLGNSLSSKKQFKKPLRVFEDIEYHQPIGKLWMKILSLKGDKSWKFKKDPLNLGMNKKWYETFDDSQWEKQDPSRAWENQGHPHHRGYGWYRKQFKIDAKWKSRKCFLELKYYRNTDDRTSTIFLNGQRIAKINQENIRINKWDPRRILIELPKNNLRFTSKNNLAIQHYDGGDSLSGIMALPSIVTLHEPIEDGPWPDYSGIYDNYLGYNQLKIIREGSEKICILLYGQLKNKSGHPGSQYKVFINLFRGSAKIDIKHVFTPTNDLHSYRYKSSGVQFVLDNASFDEIWTASTKHTLKSKLSAHSRISLFQFHDGPNRYPGYPSMKLNPFKPKFFLKDQDITLDIGNKNPGWLQLLGKTSTLYISAKNFWKSYPSELSYDQDENVLTLYMLPLSSNLTDLRNWADKKDGSWPLLEKDAEEKKPFSIHLKKDFFEKLKHDGHVLPRETKLGINWTREYQLNFERIEKESLSHEKNSIDAHILPKVSPQEACSSMASGYPLHPYDAVNFPIFELENEFNIAMSQKFNREWVNIYGMWWYGAMRYLNISNQVKFAWYRRWYNHESAKAPALPCLLQYIRTMDSSYFNYGASLANYSMNVIVKMFDPRPRSVGYGSKHSVTPFGAGNTSHINLEGISLYYLLTGDEQAKVFFEDLEKIYLKEHIRCFGYYGDPMDRQYDGATYARIILYFLNGKTSIRNWIQEAMNYYIDQIQKGFNSNGNPSYRIRLFSHAYSLLEDPIFLKAGGKSPEWLNDNISMLSNKYMNKISHAINNLAFSAIGLDSIEEGFRSKLKEKWSYNSNSNHIHKWSWQDLCLPKAIYQANLPVIDTKSLNHTNFAKLRQAYPGEPFPEFKIENGKEVNPIDIHNLFNSNPFEKRIPRSTQLHGNHRSYGLYYTHRDQTPEYNMVLKEGEIGWDVGPPSELGSKWLPAYGRVLYPSYEGYDLLQNFSGYPFGATVTYVGIPFKLVDPYSNSGNGYLVLNKNKSVEFKINQKTSRIFILGHVTTSPIDLKINPGITYRLNYQDGTNEIIKCVPYSDYNEAFNNIRLKNYSLRMIRGLKTFNDKHNPFLHLNIFYINSDSNKTLSSITCHSRIEGFSILGISAETKSERENNSKILYQDIDKKGIRNGEYLNLKLDSGWYQMIIKLHSILPKRKGTYPDAQLFLEANGKMVSGGFLSKSCSVLSFPIQSIGGSVVLRLHANYLRAKQACFKEISVRPLEEADPLALKRRKINNIPCYGFTKATKGFGNTSLWGYADHIHRDHVTKDWFDVSSNTFKAHVPNGQYNLELLLFSPHEQPEYKVTVNGKSASIHLPSQHLTPFDEIKTRAFEKLNMTIQIENNILEINFSKGLRSGKVRYVGLRAIRLTPVL